MSTAENYGPLFLAHRRAIGQPIPGDPALTDERSVRVPDDRGPGDPRGSWPANIELRVALGLPSTIGRGGPGSTTAHLTLTLPNGQELVEVALTGDEFTRLLAGGSRTVPAYLHPRAFDAVLQVERTDREIAEEEGR